MTITLSDLYSSDGSSTQIISNPLPLECRSGVCENYARRHLKISFTDMKALWMLTDSAPTQSQRDYLEKKWRYTERMTLGQVH